MASPSVLLRQIKEIRKKLASLLDYKRINQRFLNQSTGKNVFTAGEQRTIITNSRILINELLDLSIKYVDNLPMFQTFIRSYNDTRADLAKMGFKVPGYKSKSVGEMNVIKQDFLRSITTERQFLKYNVAERLKIIDSMMNVESDNIIVENQINRMNISPDEKAALLQQRRDRIFKIHKPRYTLLRQSDEFKQASKTEKGLMDDKYGKTNQQRAVSTFRNAEDKLFDVLRRGQDKGLNYNRRMSQINDITNRTFPGDKVTYFTKKGVKGSIPIDVYNENWLRYADKRMESIGTLTPMRQAGLDIIEWVLTGTNHSDICLELAGTQYFSISGESTKYPSLPTMPPAHVNCKSRLVPAPASLQEEEDITLTDQKNIQSEGFITVEEAESASQS